MEFKQWDGFERGDWCDGIDVRNFIQKNYTPYTGDESFLSVATQRTQKVNSEFKEMLKKEQQNGGVLDLSLIHISEPTRH